MKEIETEIWKLMVYPPGFEGIYEVSNFGRLKRLERRSKYKNRLLKEKIMTPIRCHEGDIYILTYEKLKKVISISMLVYCNFVKIVKCTYHIDGNIRNHKLSNLTEKDRSSLYIEKLKELCLTKKYNLRELALKLNISQHVVRNLIKKYNIPFELYCHALHKNDDIIKTVKNCCKTPTRQIWIQNTIRHNYDINDYNLIKRILTENNLHYEYAYKPYKSRKKDITK